MLEFEECVLNANAMIISIAKETGIVSGQIITKNDRLLNSQHLPSALVLEILKSPASILDLFDCDFLVRNETAVVEMETVVVHSCVESEVMTVVVVVLALSCWEKL